MAFQKGNEFYKLGLDKTGKPLIYKTPKEFEERILEYFKYIKGERGKKMVIGKDGIEEKEWVRRAENATITGLALFLGFCTKTTLYEYAKRDDYANSIKRALMMVERGYEDHLHHGAGAGPIFALKNMGWKDTQHNINTDINVILDDDDEDDTSE